jgi:drug/metabolite transporter (DMT)-like permease
MMAGFLFGEMPVLLQILGGMMIIGGVLYYSRIEKEE